MNLADLRPVYATVDSVRTLEGEGFRVRRPFPYQVDHIGPFLLLDEMGPSDNAPGEAKGAPDHPHRGFETVTYVLDGEVEHKDSMGNHGLITPGDVQWMTAGAGIVHSEMPSDLILTSGGRVHGFQLWVNLPKRDKMRPPRYQDLRAQDMPVVTMGGGSMVVIGGHAMGTTGPADTHLPVTYLHVKVYPDSEVELEVEPDDLAFMYAFRGAGETGVERAQLPEGSISVFAPGGGRVRVAAGPNGLEGLFGAAAPLHEPVVRYGPFVMNTREEIITAFDDFRAGRLGSIPAEK